MNCPYLNAPTLLRAPNIEQPYQVIGVVGDVRTDGSVSAPPSVPRNGMFSCSRWLQPLEPPGMGLILGIGLSIGLRDAVHRWAQSSLRDPSVLAVIAGAFLLASAVACLLPARRATRIDPMVALRDS